MIPWPDAIRKPQGFPLPAAWLRPVSSSGPEAANGLISSVREQLWVMISAGPGQPQEQEA
jgi:hypothetical protein